MDPQRIINLQRSYQSSKLPLYLRGKYAKPMVYSFIGLFAVTTVHSLYYTTRAVCGFHVDD
ncbi:hypothetical protein JA1_002155 [Spathaspora sp. JA1]|nr:hypothetical protein JA1_002155 [Spathaspora sp. JA1]